MIGYQPYYTESWSGVVMRSKKFYEKYLPKGSKVEFQIGLQGAIIVNNMLAGKQHIGYMGDMPSIVSTTKQEVADIRSWPPSDSGTTSATFSSRARMRPTFATAQEALKWLDGKQVRYRQGQRARTGSRRRCTRR